MTPPLKEALETLNKHLANNELEESSNSMVKIDFFQLNNF
jgi:hypothetical protein